MLYITYVLCIYFCFAPWMIAQLRMQHISNGLKFTFLCSDMLYFLLNYWNRCLCLRPLI